MAFGILAMGHGGGVPGAIRPTPVINAGNTNFALIPNIDPKWNGGAQLHLDHLNGLLDQPYWLIDCGPETMLRLCGVFGQEPVAKNLQGIFLTHCHDDHSGGIKSLAYRTKFIEGTKPMLVYPTGLAKLVKSQTAELGFLNPTVPIEDRGIGYFYDVFESEHFDTWLRSGDINRWSITAFPVSHNCWGLDNKPFPAFGYKLKTPSGKVIVFSGDTAFPISTTSLHDADYQIQDVQFYSDGSQNDHVHCPYDWIKRTVPPEHRHKVYLTHTGHDLPPEAIADGFKLFKGGQLLVIE